MQAVCTIEGCTDRLLTRGWCNKHYHRWRRHGDPLTVKNPYGSRDGSCHVSGCLRPIEARGWCGNHYWHWRKYGDPEAFRIIRGNDWDRFWSKVSGDDPLGCWEWQGERKNHEHYPYGIFWVRGRKLTAHRVAWEYLRGEIPPDPSTGVPLVLDHTCCNPPCCNPWHLDPTPPGLNSWLGGVKTPRKSR